MDWYDGFEDFVVARGGALPRTAFLPTDDHHLAADLVQSALAKAAQRWRKILDGGELAGGGGVPVLTVFGVPRSQDRITRSCPAYAGMAFSHEPAAYRCQIEAPVVPISSARLRSTGFSFRHSTTPRP